MRQRAVNCWLVIAGFFAFLFQCTTPSFAQEARKIRLGAYSAFSVAFLNVFVARDSGLFKKHSLDIELIQMAGPLPIAALSAGEIDYLTGFTTSLVAASQGAPLKGLIVTMRKPPFYIVSEPSIEKPDDLAGKRWPWIGSEVSSILLHGYFSKPKGSTPKESYLLRPDRYRIR